MATLTIPHTFLAGTPALASEVNANFQAVVSWTQGQISTDNLGILGARSIALPTSPNFAILSLSQTSSNIALNINNSGTDSSIVINQSGAIANGKGAILINSPSTQVTSGAAELLLSLATNSSIPAILVKHGAIETMSLKKDRLDLFNGAPSATMNLFSDALQASASQLLLFNSAIELSSERIKLPVRTTAQRDVVTQEGSILYNTTSKVVQYRDGTAWKDFTPTGIIQMFAGSTAPSGWLFCNGQEYLKSAYPALDSVLSAGGTYPYGQTNGSGEAGTTHFKVPDFRALFPRGSSMGTGGEVAISDPVHGVITYLALANGARRADQLQGHKHRTIDPDRATGGNKESITTANVSSPFAHPTIGPDGHPNPYNTGKPLSDGVNGTPRTGGETLPANISIAYIIKT